MRCVVCRKIIRFEENLKKNKKYLVCDCTKTIFPDGWVIDELDNIGEKGAEQG